MKKKKDAAVQVVEDKVNDACSDAMEKAQNSDDPDNSIAKAEALCDKLQAQGQKALKKIAPDVASKIKTVTLTLFTLETNLVTETVNATPTVRCPSPAFLATTPSLL